MANEQKQQLTIQELIDELKFRFPWLETDDSADGAETVSGLAEWVEQLRDEQAKEERKLIQISRTTFDVEKQMIKAYRVTVEAANAQDAVLKAFTTDPETVVSVSITTAHKPSEWRVYDVQGREVELDRAGLKGILPNGS